MENKKYKLGEKHPTFNLYRVIALVAFAGTSVKEGDIGGWVESEKNLSHNGNAWVYGDARVTGDARVSGDAQVSGNAWVYGNARVYGNAWVYGDAQVSGNAWVYGDAQVTGDARVTGDAWVSLSIHYFTLGPLGSRASFLTIHKDERSDWRVNTGCFSGTVAEFKKKVEETHGDNTHGKAYASAIKYAMAHIKAVNTKPRAKKGTPTK